MYDLIITGGEICDGTGRPRFRADLGVQGDRIVNVGEIPPAEHGTATVIDASGRLVTPGFIDVHNHSDHTIVLYPRAESMVMQGVTTVINGNCGSSAAPVRSTAGHNTSEESTIRDRLSPDKSEFPWTDLDGYFRHVESRGSGVNMASFVGHGTVRQYVMGPDNRPPGEEDMRMMQRLVLDAVGQGAIGMTTGLIFVPGCYAETGEIIQLAQTMRGIDNVLYASHTRSLNERIIEGNEEAAAVGEAAGIPVVLSHMCPAPPLWGAAGPVLRGIEAIRARGIDVTLDMFPYTYGANALFNMVPSWAREQGAAGLVQSLKDPSFRSRVKEDTLRYGAATGGSAKRGLIREGKWDLIWISGATRTPEYNGMSIAEIAELRGQDPYDAMLDLTIEEGPDTGIMGGDRTEEDLREILAHPLTMIGSDGRADAPGGIPDLPVHPRAYGCFPRVLSRYVREQRLMSVEEAIRKMTLLPAQTMRIRDRGLLCKGQFADVVVFDPVTIADHAGIKNPKEYPSGISHVVVNGVPVIAGGRHTGALPGKVLRRESH